MKTKKNINLTLLGKNNVKIPENPESAILEKFDNPVKTNDYVIRFNAPEFTALCPITAQPDFGNLIIDYIPNKYCVESKSLKLFLNSFRNHGAFHEQVSNYIIDRIFTAIKPKWIRITALFYRRGGISIDIFAERGRPPKSVNLPPLPRAFENGRFNY